MKTITTLVTTTSLLGSGTALAHGMHTEVPANSLLHLLVHNWPLLLGAIALFGLYRWVRKTR